MGINTARQPIKAETTWMEVEGQLSRAKDGFRQYINEARAHSADGMVTGQDVMAGWNLMMLDLSYNDGGEQWASYDQPGSFSYLVTELLGSDDEARDAAQKELAEAHSAYRFDHPEYDYTDPSLSGFFC